MQFILSSQQVKGSKQSHEPVIMISVKVTDKYMADPLKPDMKFADLQLGAFRAINQKQALIRIEQMSAWISGQGRDR